MKNDLTIYEAFKEAAKKYPNDLALYYQGTKITYKALNYIINKMANT